MDLTIAQILRVLQLPLKLLSAIYDSSFFNCGKNFTIYGYGGTEAEACALRNDFNFVQLQVVPTSVALNKTTLTLDIGKTSNLRATVYPSNASNKNALGAVQTQALRLLTATVK